MKYRIVTNGGKFRIQKRMFGFWFTVTEWNPPSCMGGCGWDSPLEFKSAQTAELKIEELLAPKSVEPKWKPVKTL